MKQFKHKVVKLVEVLKEGQFHYIRIGAIINSHELSNEYLICALVTQIRYKSMESLVPQSYSKSTHYRQLLLFETSNHTQPNPQQ